MGLKPKRFTVLNDNRWGRSLLAGSTGSGGRFALDELKAMAEASDAILIPGRVFWSKGGASNTDIVRSVNPTCKLFVYVNVLQTPRIEEVASSGWPFEVEWAKLNNPYITGSVAWHRTKPSLYWVNLDGEPVALAEHLKAKHPRRRPDGFFLDYLTQRPRDSVSGDLVPYDVPRLIDWQRRFVEQLALGAEFYVAANGRWPVETTDWDSQLWGVYWEAMGDHWTDVRNPLRRISNLAKRNDVIHLLDPWRASRSSKILARMFTMLRPNSMLVRR